MPACCTAPASSPSTGTSRHQLAARPGGRQTHPAAIWFGLEVGISQNRESALSRGIYSGLVIKVMLDGVGEKKTRNVYISHIH